MIEAVVEDEAVKAEIFAELDRVITDPDAVLASNTSSIPIMKIAAATKNPRRVLGLHFFNPVPVLPLVELVSTLVTDEAAAARTEEFASAVLGKQVVRCSDRSGFVVNALLVPYLLSAIRMVEAGFATVEDVDKAVVAGLSHPMGPLRLSDLVGLDTLKLIADKMFEEFKEPHYGAPAAVAADGRGGFARQEIGRGFLHLLRRLRVAAWASSCAGGLACSICGCGKVLIHATRMNSERVIGGMTQLRPYYEESQSSTTSRTSSLRYFSTRPWATPAPTSSATT